MKKKIIIIFSVLTAFLTVASGIDSDISADTFPDYEYSVNIDGQSCTIERYHGTSEDVIIPSEIDGKTVTVIGESAFENELCIQSVAVPESVISIENSAFYGCDSLIKVSLPNTLTNIGAWAFAYCRNLKSAIIPESVTYIGDSAFECCYVLSDIIIPDGVTYIGNAVFYACKSIESINIPDSVSHIGDMAFVNCLLLTEINVGDNSAYSSENGVLFDKDKTTLIQYPTGKSDKIYTIPVGVTSIGDRAFENCYLLEKVIIPNGVVSIGYLAFYNCSVLGSITVPESIVSIGRNAFVCSEYYYNESNWENGLLYLDKYLVGVRKSITGTCEIKQGTLLLADCVFFECDELESVILPGSLFAISKEAFYNCVGLKSVTIHQGVSIIENHAFSRCKQLENIIIPDSVSRIGDFAFELCYMLKEIIIPDSVNYIGDNVFYGTDCLAFCYEYSYAEHYFKENGIQYEIISETPYGDVNCDGMVNLKDFIYLKKSVALGNYIAEADLTGNNLINSEDLAVLKKILLSH